MAEYPTRQFSATNAYNAYMQALEDEEEKKKAYNMVHHMYKLTNPHYAGSSAESSNLSKISKLGSGTSSGLATRLRLMTAADKENLGMEFTGAFQQALESDLFTSLASFNTWANKQGPWYDEDLRRKHATTVKDMLDAQKSHKVSEAVSELYAKYAPAWGSRLVADQDRVIGEIEDDEVISSLPKKYRAEAIKQIHALLQGGIPATGQYAARDQVLQEEAAARDVDRLKATQDQARLKQGSVRVAREGAYRLFDYMETPEDKPGIGLGLSFEDAKAKIIEEMRGTGWDEKAFEDVVKNLREPARKEAFDPERGEDVFATPDDIATGKVVPKGAKPVRAESSWWLAANLMRFQPDIAGELGMTGEEAWNILLPYLEDKRKLANIPEEYAKLIALWSQVIVTSGRLFQSTKESPWDKDITSQITFD